jgi:site-specific DNA-methyltransferase (adenine-specific)
MFTAELMMSNPKMWRYNLVWDKVAKTGFLNANRMPLRQHEDICVFYKQLPTYNPQMRKGKPYKDKARLRHSNQQTLGVKQKKAVDNEGIRYPNATIMFSNGNNNNVHPTQKPIALLEYLIKTYTNEGETVLDFTMGSGSTGVACINTNRNFIGIELDKGYFDIAKQRIESVVKE